MRAAVSGRAGAHLELREVPDPSPLPGELVLRVRACGICGSDLHLAAHFDLSGHVLGHEFSGEVVAIGSDPVGTWRPGDRVVALPLVGCGECAACRAGATRKCAGALGVGIERPGAFAEYVAVSSRETLRLPDALDHHLGALVEPLAVGLHALDRVAMVPGDDVLVLGGGPVGLTVALWARELGARHVVVSDPVPGRRELAERCGATGVVDPTVDDVASAFADLAGAAPGVTVECVGIPGLIQQAVDVAPVDGRVGVVGVCMTPDMIVPLTAVAKELTLQFAFYYRHQDFERTIAAIESGRLDPRGMLTDVVDLDALPRIFADLARPTTECKVLVEP